jgi:hypothetical protein
MPCQNPSADDHVNSNEKPLLAATNPLLPQPNGFGAVARVDYFR